MAAPVDISVFGGYFPFATKHILDVPVLFNQYGLADIWRDAYAKAGGVVWLSAAGQDPCHFNTKKALNSLADLQGLRLYTFPTAGKFLAQFGVIPVSIPYEDVQVAVQTGELDGMSWSGITEDYTVGWADVTDHFTTNNISGAWIGSWFVNEKKLGRHAGASEEALARLRRRRPHLPQPVVLGRRGQAARHRRQAEADDDPGGRMGRGRECGAEVLGRDRCRERDQGQGRRHLQAVQRNPEEGRRRLHAGLRLNDAKPALQRRLRMSTIEHEQRARHCRAHPRMGRTWPAISHSTS